MCRYKLSVLATGENITLENWGKLAYFCQLLYFILNSKLLSINRDLRFTKKHFRTNLLLDSKKPGNSKHFTIPKRLLLPSLNVKYIYMKFSNDRQMVYWAIFLQCKLSFQIDTMAFRYYIFRSLWTKLKIMIQCAMEG